MEPTAALKDVSFLPKDRGGGLDIGQGLGGAAVRQSGVPEVQMRRVVQPVEDFAFRAGAATVGAVLLASAGLAADVAREHMVFLGTICGASPIPHCGWCYGAAGLVLAGLAAFASALAPARATAA
jgi:hypothetical protein